MGCGSANWCVRGDRVGRGGVRVSSRVRIPETVRGRVTVRVRV